MTLTPEERRRIYEEEKARIEGEAMPAPEPEVFPSTPVRQDNIGDFLRGPGGAFLIAGGLLLALFLVSVAHMPPSAEERFGSSSSSENTSTYSTPETVPSTPVQTEAPPSPPKPLEWHTVKTIKGSTNKNTETFTITGDEWRLYWKTEPGEYGDSNFMVDVFNADGSEKDGAVNTIGAGKDMTVERGAGDYYLKITTSQPYAIVIEELR